MADFSLPNTIANGQLGDATPVQQNFAAIAAAINTTLIRTDGTVAMTGALALPGNPTDALQAAPKQYVDAAIPVGFISPAANASAPNAMWLLCDGSAVSRATYATLFTAIGTSYGAGDGSTTFNLPSLQGRMVVGRTTGNTALDALGETGGSADATLPAHTHGVSGTSATVSNDHTHAFSGSTSTNGSHVHTFSPWGNVIEGFDANLDLSDGGGAFGYQLSSQVNANGDHAHTFSGSTGGISANHSHTFSVTSASAGTTATNANLPPYQVVNYFIKVS